MCPKIRGQDTSGNLATNVPAENHGTSRTMSTSSKQGTKPRSAPRPKHGHRWRPLQNLQMNQNSWKIPEHMLSKKDLSSGELATLRKSRNPTPVITVNGEVQMNEKHRYTFTILISFVTVQLLVLDDTPAVLSSGKLCEKHGYTYEWASGKKPHLTKNGKRIVCKTENFVSVVAPGLSSSSSASSFSTSLPHDSSSTSPSPTRFRLDILCSVNKHARAVTKWTRACDTQ